MGLSLQGLGKYVQNTVYLLGSIVEVGAKPQPGSKIPGFSAGSGNMGSFQSGKQKFRRLSGMACSQDPGAQGFMASRREKLKAKLLETRLKLITPFEDQG
jgi:hypothetical protein